MTVRPAEWPEDLPEARRLLRAYAEFLLGNPAGAVKIDTEAYEEELAALPVRYAEPDAVLLLAVVEAQPAGCVAVIQRRDRPGSCEMKRLWTEPVARGHGLGRALVAAAREWAADHGAEFLLLDTVAAAMPEAIHLYERMGFERTERHNTNPVPGLTFMKARLL